MAPRAAAAGSEPERTGTDDVDAVHALLAMLAAKRRDNVTRVVAVVRMSSHRLVITW
ncbi:Hypothetical protein A7982_02185 [Minicystis rosea]|nr:Hypothetical protein A7982_02185 [Minicystis rosea]